MGTSRRCFTPSRLSTVLQVLRHGFTSWHRIFEPFREDGNALPGWRRSWPIGHISCRTSRCDLQALGIHARHDRLPYWELLLHIENGIQRKCNLCRWLCSNHGKCCAGSICARCYAGRSERQAGGGASEERQESPVIAPYPCFVVAA